MNTRFVKINDAWKRVVNDFSMQDIHTFRIEMKKLRSVLGLVSSSRPASALKVSSRLDGFYNAIGAIRSLQLQKIAVEKISPEDVVIQKTYLTFISKEIEHQKLQAKKMGKHRTVIKKNGRRILKQLPSGLKQASIRFFTNEKLHALTALMTPSSLSDESLHATRKLLKEISYTWKLTKKRTSLPSVIIMSKKEIDSITRILGDFQDSCVQLDLLHAHYKQQQID